MTARMLAITALFVVSCAVAVVEPTQCAAGECEQSDDASLLSILLPKSSDDTTNADDSRPKPPAPSDDTTSTSDSKSKAAAPSDDTTSTSDTKLKAASSEDKCGGDGRVPWNISLCGNVLPTDCSTVEQCKAPSSMSNPIACVVDWGPGNIHLDACSACEEDASNERSLLGCIAGKCMCQLVDKTVGTACKESNENADCQGDDAMCWASEKACAIAGQPCHGLGASMPCKKCPSDNGQGEMCLFGEGGQGHCVCGLGGVDD